MLIESGEVVFGTDARRLWDFAGGRSAVQVHYVGNARNGA
jgi:hypothetical protein